MMKNRYKVLIVTCWYLLFIAFLLKVCGVTIFDANSDNQVFIQFCDYLDKTLWLKYILFCLVAIVLESLYLLAVLKQKFYTRLQFIIFIPLIIFSSIISWYIVWLKFVIDILIMLLPIAFKANWKRVLVGIVLVVVFELISFMIKNISCYNLNNKSALVELILQSDTVIMTALYYLYSVYGKVGIGGEK